MNNTGGIDISRQLQCAREKMAEKNMNCCNRYMPGIFGPVTVIDDNEY